jgi:hypothetical protein
MLQLLRRLAGYDCYWSQLTVGRQEPLTFELSVTDVLDYLSTEFETEALANAREPGPKSENIFTRY